MTEPQPHDLPRSLGGQAPSGYFVLMVPECNSAGPDLATVLSVIRSRFLMIAMVGLLSAAVSGSGSLLLRNEYESTVLVAPVTLGQGGMGVGLRSQLGGLAALAGLSLGSESGTKEKALATLRSKGFVREFIESRALMQVLFEDEWNPEIAAWRKPNQAPTLDDGVKRFRRDVLSIIEDKRTGLVTVSVRWYSPEVAAAWANELVASANKRLREAALRETENNIRYLTQEAEKTESVEVRRSIYSLLETQVNDAMLANVRPDYAFNVIDAARASDRKNKVAPQRVLLAIAGGFLGSVLAMAIVLWRRREQLQSPKIAG